MNKQLFLALAASLIAVVPAHATPANSAICADATTMTSFAGYINCAGPYSGNINGSASELTQLNSLFGGVWTWKGKSDDSNAGPFTAGPNTNTGSGNISFDTPQIGFYVVGIKQSNYYSFYLYSETAAKTIIPWSSLGTASGQSDGISHIGFYTGTGGLGADCIENPNGSCVSITTVTPEPSTYALMGAGLLAMFGVARRRRQA